MEYKAETMHREVTKILGLKEEGNYEKLKGFVVPYLYEGKLFEKDGKEYLDELLEFLSREEAEAAYEDERPDVVTASELGYGVAFLLDWKRKMKHAEVLDWLSKKMAEDVSPETVLTTAKKNLMKTNFVAEPVLDADSDDGFMTVRYSNAGVPDYSSSFLLDERGLKNVRELLGNFIISPYFREVSLVAPAEIGAEEFRKKAKEVETALADRMYVKFSDRTFLYDGTKLTEI